MASDGKTGMARWLPILGWLPAYRREWFRADLIAGVTVWALVVPQAIAYAQIAGLPPQAGVFASFAAPLGYALYGTSRQLIVSPTSATAAISAALVTPLVVAGDVAGYAALSAALAILCGLLFLLLGRFNMGFLAQFIAPSVQTGFLVGLGLTIMIGQVCKILGIESEEGPFYKQAWHVLTSLDATSGWTLAVGGISLVLLFVMRRVAPSLPMALILVVLSIVVVTVFSLDDRGVAVVGGVSRAIPALRIPRVPVTDLLTLIPGTFAIVVIGYSESMSVARGFADRHHYRVDANKEFTALGMSSIFGGLFQGFITGGGASQSAANDRAGAKTPVAAIVLSILAFLSAILLLPFFRDLPHAVLGAIVIFAVVGFVDIPAMQRLQRLRSDSYLLAMVALVGVLVLGILPGLLISVAISILVLLGRLSRPNGDALGRLPQGDVFVPIDDSDGVATESGLLVYRLEAPLIFVNSTWNLDLIRAEIERQPRSPQVVVLDMSANDDLEVAGIDFLESLHRELEHDQRELWLSRVNPKAMTIIQRSDLKGILGEDRIHRTNRDAWEAFHQRFPPGPAQPGRGGPAAHTR
ncbi:MAG TPA: sulfate permease [Thermomicrobiales bacterium]|nr:sulfate permease [Thermomicrobiales bacterium]